MKMKVLGNIMAVEDEGGSYTIAPDYYIIGWPTWPPVKPSAIARPVGEFLYDSKPTVIKIQKR